MTTLNSRKVQAYGGAIVELQGHGELRCAVPSDRGSSVINLPRVEVLPSGPPLASISNLTDHGFVFAFMRTHAVMFHPDGARTRCNRVGEHYHLDISATGLDVSTAGAEDSVTDVAFAATDNSLRDELLQIHESLAHASSTKMLALASEVTGRRLDLRPEMVRVLREVQSFGDICEHCAQAKLTKSSLRKQTPNNFTIPGEGVSIDFFVGPCLSKHRHRYCLLFVDLATGYLRQRFVYSRSEASRHIREYVEYCRSRGGAPPSSQDGQRRGVSRE